MLSDLRDHTALPSDDDTAHPTYPAHANQALMYTPAQPPSPTLSFFTSPTRTTPLHHLNHHNAPIDVEPAPQRTHQYYTTTHPVHITPQPAGSPPTQSIAQTIPVPTTPIPDNSTGPGHSALHPPGYPVDRSFNPITNTPDPRPLTPYAHNDVPSSGDPYQPHRHTTDNMAELDLSPQSPVDNDITTAHNGNLWRPVPPRCNLDHQFQRSAATLALLDREDDLDAQPDYNTIMTCQLEANHTEPFNRRYEYNANSAHPPHSNDATLSPHHLLSSTHPSEPIQGRDLVLPPPPYAPLNHHTCNGPYYLWQVSNWVLEVASSCTVFQLACYPTHRPIQWETLALTLARNTNLTVLDLSRHHMHSSIGRKEIDTIATALVGHRQLRTLILSHQSIVSYDEYSTILSGLASLLAAPSAGYRCPRHSCPLSTVHHPPLSLPSQQCAGSTLHICHC